MAAIDLVEGLFVGGTLLLYAAGWAIIALRVWLDTMEVVLRRRCNGAMRRYHRVIEEPWPVTIALLFLVASTAASGTPHVPVRDSEELASAIEVVAARCGAYALREARLDVQSIARLQEDLAGDKFLAWKDINTQSRYLQCIAEVGQLSEWIYEEDRDGADTLIKAGELYDSGEVPESFELVAERVSEYTVVVGGREASFAEFRDLIRERNPASVLVRGKHPDGGYCMALLGLVTRVPVFVTNEPDSKPHGVSYRADHGIGSKQVAFIVNQCLRDDATPEEGEDQDTGS